MADIYPKYGEMIEVECRIVWPKLALTEADIANLASKRTGKSKNYKDKKNSLEALIKKSDKATIKMIVDACLDVAGVDSEADLVRWPLLDKNGDLRDGDDEAHAEKEGYAGCVYFKTSSNRDIDMVQLDDKGEVVEVKDEDAAKVFYQGANCMLILQVCEWEEGSITFYLQGIMRLNKDGKKLVFSETSKQTKKIFQKFASKGTKKEVVEEDDGGVAEDYDAEEEVEAPKTLAKAKKAKKVLVEEVEEDEEEVEAPKIQATPKSRAGSLSSILN